MSNFLKSRQFRMFDFVEQTLERAVEGTVGRILPSKLQPAEIARRIEREMTIQQVVGIDGPIAPNAFHVLLNPLDADQLKGMYETLTSDLETWLETNAMQRGIRFVGDVSVDIRADERVSRRGIRITTAMIETALPQPVPKAATRTELIYRLHLYSRHGEGRSIPLRNGFTIIGRAPASDVVIDDPSVSRYHARIEVQDYQIEIRDLDSTNGTTVNQRGISHAPLEAGDTLFFGSIEARIAVQPSQQNDSTR